MEPTPLWLLPHGWNPNAAEGTRAYQEGRSFDSHGYGESAAAKDFERAWRAEQRRSLGV